MAASNANFNLVGLDPDSFKQSLIQFLQSQNQFSGYNFTGTNINVLLDVLSRNTFQNAFLLNMAFAESMLDSAQLRDSVVSKAKELNYIAGSATSAVAAANITIYTTTGTIFEIPAGTRFVAQNDRGTLLFTTNTNYIQTSSNGVYQFANVILQEGTYVTDLFTVDNSVNNQLFTLTNPTIDISSISISVAENFGATNTQFTQANNIYSLGSNSRVFFLQATSNNQYEFQFGDGVLGYQPQNGSVVTANYRVTLGSTGNECSVFSLSDNLAVFNNTSITNVTIATLSNSAGGADAENIESIRFNAPRAYQAQDRAVTSNDYKTLILKNFPQVGDVSVFGGGITGNSVNYGTVYLAMVSPSGNPLTQTNKDLITGFLQQRNIFGITPTTVDANTLWLNISSNVHVDFTQTNSSPNFFQSLVTNTISTFSSNNIQKFNTAFRYSNLTDAIDSSNSAIISNETSYTMKRYVPVQTGNLNTMYVSFFNQVADVQSSYFISNGQTCFITDTYSAANINPGDLDLVILNANNQYVTSYKVGHVDYPTGTLTVGAIQIDAFTTQNQSFYFTCSPVTQDLQCANEAIIQIDLTTLNLNILSG